MKEKVKEILQVPPVLDTPANWAGPSLLAIGNVCADQYLTENMLYPGGECANTAFFASRFGVKSGFIGMFGNDESAEMMRRTLAENGVDLSRCRYYDEESAFTRVKRVNGDRVFVESNSGGPLRHHPFALDPEDMRYIASFDLIYTGLHGYMDSWIPMIRESILGSQPAAACEALTERACETPTDRACEAPADCVCETPTDSLVGRRALIAYDFSFRREPEFIRQIAPHLVAALVSMGDLPAAKRHQVTDLLIDCGVRLIVGTMGNEGSMVITGGKIFTEAAAPCHQLVDTNGAGDCYFASLLSSLLKVCAERKLPPLSEEVLAEEETVRKAMKKAAIDAAEICRMEGAYGCGIELPPSALRAQADWKRE